MTNYHRCADGKWMRCRAVKRKGAGVTACPIGESDHTEGLQGVSLAGGGVVRRAVGENCYRLTEISTPVGGVFTAITGKRKRQFRVRDGVAVTAAARQSPESESVSAADLESLFPAAAARMKRDEEMRDTFDLYVLAGDSPERAFRFAIREFGVRSSVLEYYLEQTHPDGLPEMVTSELLDAFIEFAWGSVTEEFDELTPVEVEDALRRWWRREVDPVEAADFAENEEFYAGLRDASETGDAMIAALVEQFAADMHTD